MRMSVWILGMPEVKKRAAMPAAAPKPPARTPLWSIVSHVAPGRRELSASRLFGGPAVLSFPLNRAIDGLSTGGCPPMPMDPTSEIGMFAVVGSIAECNSQLDDLGNGPAGNVGHRGVPRVVRSVHRIYDRVSSAQFQYRPDALRVPSLAWWSDRRRKSRGQGREPTWGRTCCGR